MTDEAMQRLLNILEGKPVPEQIAKLRPLAVFAPEMLQLPSFKTWLIVNADRLSPYLDERGAHGKVQGDVA